MRALAFAILVAASLPRHARSPSTTSPRATRPTSPRCAPRSRPRTSRRAIAELTPMLETHQHADVYNLMGFSLRKSGDHKQAYTFYRKALDFDPEHKGALEYLGELYVETGQIDKARENVALLKKLCPAAARSWPISNRLLRRLRPKPASSRPPTIEGAHVVDGPGGGGVCRPPPAGGDLPARSLEQAHGLFGGCRLHAGLRHSRGAPAVRHRPRVGLRPSDRVRLSHPRRRAAAGGLLPRHRRRCSTASSATAISSCISRRTWRSRAGCWCCLPMAPAPGRSMRYGQRYPDPGAGRAVRPNS